MRPRPSTDLAELLVESVDDVGAMLVERCEGLDWDEYLWEPVPDCFESYSERAFGSTATGLDGREWVEDPDEALQLTAAAIGLLRDLYPTNGSGGS